MIEFKILKKSDKSRARLGILKTPHGEIETPTLVGVATQAVVKTLTSEEVAQIKSKLLICNTYHLHLRPGEKIIKENGGLHKFMNWKSGLMTDSGGFQVFSLGFGRDFGMGKILKSSSEEILEEGRQPRHLKITDDGVYFKSYLDGREMFLGPKESIKIQEDLGADIILAFDECTSPIAGRTYTEKSLERTHRWAATCLKAKKSKQALYGVVQGGKFRDLRIASAKFIDSLGFDGYAIGGEFGDDKATMVKMLGWVNNELDEQKPRHLLGIGYLEDIPKIIKSGVDTFDCTMPTHYGRRGIAFISSGRLDLNKAVFLKDKGPLDKKCGCPVCGEYKRSYISHLIRAKEITGLKLLTMHNLFFFNSYVEKIREDIKKGKI
ncbi:MAG: tRNA guanosine(34) transglycosylase Tgt [Patescibacteria group bacterium]|nr:tRNA guanosine(34) transglycosylase Tgt [Patescibacteria group bacterium]MCL5261840.1 tRNA guanosine(34) transglycosylase Tgt [Patescibacteria group bacterium]